MKKKRKMRDRDRSGEKNVTVQRKRLSETPLMGMAFHSASHRAKGQRDQKSNNLSKRGTHEKKKSDAKVQKLRKKKKRCPEKRPS